MPEGAGAGHQHRDNQQQRNGHGPGRDSLLSVDDQVRGAPGVANGFHSEQEEAPDAVGTSSVSSCRYSPHPIVFTHLAPIIAVFALSKNLSIPT